MEAQIVMSIESSVNVARVGLWSRKEVNVEKKEGERDAR